MKWTNSLKHTTCKYWHKKWVNPSRPIFTPFQVNITNTMWGHFRNMQHRIVFFLYLDWKNNPPLAWKGTVWCSLRRTGCGVRRGRWHTKKEPRTSSELLTVEFSKMGIYNRNHWSYCDLVSFSPLKGWVTKRCLQHQGAATSTKAWDWGTFHQTSPSPKQRSLERKENLTGNK
jgi:hypothetical protein